MDRLEALKAWCSIRNWEQPTRKGKIDRACSDAGDKLAPDKVDAVRTGALFCASAISKPVLSTSFPNYRELSEAIMRMDGEPEEVATAVREHYLPAFAGDSLPKGIVGALVSIADRMDTIAGCFSVGFDSHRSRGPGRLAAQCSRDYPDPDVDSKNR